MAEESASTKVHYSFRAAHEANAFHQFPLLDEVSLRREARERGIVLHVDPHEQLERLDEAGAFCPVLFEGDEVV